MTDVMTVEHPQWNEFAMILEGPDGCNFQKDNEGHITWNCTSRRDRPHARTILENWGDIDVEASLAYFDCHGGYCDCEILFNVDREC